MKLCECSHTHYLPLQEIKLPSTMSADLQELINGLLVKNHKERLGCRGQGYVYDNNKAKSYDNNIVCLRVCNRCVCVYVSMRVYIYLYVYVNVCV